MELLINKRVFKFIIFNKKSEYKGVRIFKS